MSGTEAERLEAFAGQMRILAERRAWGAAHEAIEDFQRTTLERLKIEALPVFKRPILDCGLPSGIAVRIEGRGFETVEDVLEAAREAGGLRAVIDPWAASGLANWIESVENAAEWRTK